MSKNIYIAWHSTSHGIGYMKQILGAFYGGQVSVTQQKMESKNLSQKTIENIFVQKPSGWSFDKVYYLTVDEGVFYQIATQKSKFELLNKDTEEISDTDENIWERVYNRNKTLSEEIEYLKNEFPDEANRLLRQTWRRIHYYPIKDQILWFMQYSNASNIYKDRFKEQCFKSILNIRDYREIAKCIDEWLKNLQRENPDANFVINISQGSNETQVVWFALQEKKCLPENTRFIASYDCKTTPQIKFKDFYIEEIDRDIFPNILPKTIFADARSRLREIAREKMKIYAKSGFAILIIGERGTGKSEIAAEFQKGEKFYKINCASLEDDSKAEAELFGYVKGAFTGADQNGKAGLFDLAKNGTLFFDEIHRLSKRVQDKLMLALQTDSQNRFQFRPISSNEEKYTKFLAIFATNLPPIELSKFLLPDFYDRIAQLVIELPPLRETRDDIEMDWKKIWHQLRFSKPCPSGQELFDWLRTLELPGNYRDLQKIAIYYNTFLDFPLELRSKLGIENALDFTKKEYKKYQNILAYPPHNEKLQKLELPQKEHPRYNFRENARAEDMIQEYRLALAEWVLQVNQGNLKKSAKQLEISTKTLQNWQKKEDPLLI